VVFFNYTAMQMTAKIVYYGPGLCGKTTNLLHVHQKTAPGSRGEMVSLETETDRTLFFDLLPLDIGVIGGLKVRLQLYTVPGQVFYNATRKLVLKGVDGVVFVADSQGEMIDANVESLRNLRENLSELGLNLQEIPLVFQYNKRDLPDILSVEELNGAINPYGLVFHEAAALHGIGVFETLKSITRLTIQEIRGAALGEAPAKRAPGRPAAVSVPKPPERPAAVGVAAESPGAEDADAAPAKDPLGHLVEEEVPPVEFAEEDTDKIAVRAVKTRDSGNIRRALSDLRETADRPEARAQPKPNSVQRRLEELLVSERAARRELRRSATLEVPRELLRAGGTLRVHVAFDAAGQRETLDDAVSVHVSADQQLKRTNLHIDLELKERD
jgi:signal recognition particle receptor subunit beta